MNIKFSWQRLFAVILKEFVHMKRDRMTFAMIIGIPILQLILFGFAINVDPKDLPTVVIDADKSAYTREVIVALQNSGYFNIWPGVRTEKEAKELLARGKIQFAIYIPQNFTTRLIQQKTPSILVEVDATDPASSSFALAVVQDLNKSLNKKYAGPLEELQRALPPINFVVHAKYNPDRITQYNIVPGLLGVVLTMTMVIITSLALVRERERGTMESLLAMPIQPSEVMLGKIVPYVLVGYIQVTLILLASYYIFKVPINGSLLLLSIASLFFIVTNLSIGLLFSTIAQNQLQAMQLAFFFFLPSLLLSGYMFPFNGMPNWAQVVGKMLPLTHFLPIVRGILLKGNHLVDILPHLFAFVVFWVVISYITIKRYKRTLD